MWNLKQALVLLLVAGLLAVAGSSALAARNGDELAACLTHNGRLVKIAEGSNPSDPCTGKQTEVQWPSAAQFDALERRVADLESVATPAPVVLYTATQVLASVAPGDFGSVRSRCDLGDQVVSGEFVVRAVKDYNIVFSGTVIDGVTGQESWAFGIENNDAGVADLRLAARCLEATP